jgi:hypothetical protein
MERNLRPELPTVSNAKKPVKIRIFQSPVLFSSIRIMMEIPSLPQREEAAQGESPLTPGIFFRKPFGDTITTKVIGTMG